MTNFLPNPLPARVCELSFRSNGLELKHPPLMFSVGLHVKTEDIHGLKIVPQTRVAVAIGEVYGDKEKTFLDLDISMARDVARRMIEMCDAADRMNANAA